MSIVAVHGPNTFGSRAPGGFGAPATPTAGVPAPAKVTVDPTDGTKWTVLVTRPGVNGAGAARTAADFDWTYTGIVGVPASGSAGLTDKLGPVVVDFTDPGAGVTTNATLTLTIAGTAGTGDPMSGVYTWTLPVKAGAVSPSLLMAQQQEEEPPTEYSTQALEEAGPFDPVEHTVEEVRDYVTANPDDLDRVYTLESEGRARVTLLDWLEAQP